MKKTLLLSALVVTATAFAATTGNFKVDTKHGLELAHNYDKGFAKAISETTHEVKLSTEVTLGESGVTLGGDLTVNKDLLKEEHTVKGFNANAKYTFMTKVEGLKAFIKGNVGGEDLKNIGKDSTNNNALVLKSNVVNVKGEAEVSYEKAGITYLLNSNTTSEIVTADDTATTFTSQQLLKLSGKKDRLDDILLSFKLDHGYIKTAPVLVTLEGKGAIEVVKNLKVGIHDTFYVTGVDGTDKKTKGVILGEDDAKKLNTKGDLANFFALYAEYKTDTFEGMAKTAVEFRKVGTDKEIAFGEKLEANYKGVKNLQLKANALFAGIKTDALRGLITLGGNIVYTAKVNDKLTLTPDLGASVKFADLTKDAVVITGQLVPQFKVEYAATKDVKLTSSMKTTINFDQTNGYNGTNFETKLGLAYTW